MKTTRRSLPVLLFVLLGLLFIGFATIANYNALQRQEEKVFQDWSNLDASLQRRADLIPNLVTVVKAYAKHESETLQNIANARSTATQTKLSADDLSNHQAMQKFSESQAELANSLSKLAVIVENYPNLKADQNFRDLQHQLEGTENRINYSRIQVNQSIASFNASIRTFPKSVVNNLFAHLSKKEFFLANETAKDSPEVNFG